MGCDIHPHYEIQQEDGSWKFHDFRALYQTGTDEDGPILDYGKLFDDPLYLGRHYRFFAFLANVRNGSGFAGCDTGDAVKPIAKPRGVPEDASQEYKDAVDELGGDGHSHSWFTAKELVDADWDQTTVERGYISLSDYPRFKEQGNMDDMSSCGDVFGRNVIKLTEADAATLLEQATPESLKKDDRYYVNVEYRCPLKQELSYEYDTWLPVVLALHEDPTRIRMCFFFDN